jgi:hypothetical protein
MCERVQMSDDPDEELWWDSAGRLYLDRELTQPTPLQIVRPT